MKRKLSFVCLVALLFGLALPVAASFSAPKFEQVARGDKKVHHPVNVHSISGGHLKMV